MSGYMSIVERCLRVIMNNPGGVTWPRLNERIDILAKASKREKTQVFQHLKGKNNVWNNDADDMADTLFMSAAEAPTEDAVSEASPTRVSATAASKRERLAKYGSSGVIKVDKVVERLNPEPVAAKPEVAPMNERIVRLPTSKTGIVFGNNNLIDEDDVIMEMAWHIYESGEHGMTISSLRMSVPEYSDCDEADRRYLVKQMSQRYGIGLYERWTVTGDRTIKVLCRRGGSHYTLTRPGWFINHGRKPFQFSSEMLNEVKPQVATFGQVTGNAMFDQLAALKATAAFNQASSEEMDEFDEEEDDTGMEVEGTLAAQPMEPLNQVVQSTLSEAKSVIDPSSPSIAYHDTPKAEAPSVAPKQQAVTDSASDVVTQPQAGVSKEEVTQAADTLRLIAAQLEAQATVSEEMRQKKERFDILMRMARESSVQIQTALDNHNELLDDLQKAANDLSSL